MFSKLKGKLFSDNQPEIADVPYEATAGNALVINDCVKIQSLDKEYTELRLFLDSEPVHDDPETWNWICGKLAYFKMRGLEKYQFGELCMYTIRHFPRQYAEKFDCFMRIVESVSYVTTVCEQFLIEQRHRDAKNVASPCMAYLKECCQLYSQGQLCFSCVEEAIIYAAEYGDSGEKRTPDDYAAFFLCYARILLWKVYHYEELSHDDRQNIEFCLGHAENLSPCNASLWELRATTVRDSDPKAYRECIEKALRYSVTTGSIDGLGKIYENLAIFYFPQNYALADSLCTLCSKYGGNSEKVKFVLAGCKFDPFPDAEIAVHQAGIQVGYSSLARMAQEKANEFRRCEGIEEKENRRCKVLLSATDSNYQYEVRDPMTVVGRSSAMSEYLKRKPTVSRVHVRLVKEKDQLFVSDMDALNGTYVNGIRIGTHRQELHEGDELRLGSSSERGARFTMKITK